MDPFFDRQPPDKRNINIPLSSIVTPDLTAQVQKDVERNRTQLTEFANRLFQAANDIESDLNQAEANPGQEQSRLRHATGVACRALESILETPHLRQAMILLASLPGATAERQKAMISLEDFIQAEARILKESKASTGAQQEALGVFRRILTGMHDGRRLPKRDVFAVIVQIKEATCGLSLQMDRMEAEAQRNERTKRRLTRIRRLCIGLGCVLLNAAFMHTLGDPFTQVSMAVGLVWVKVAVED